MRRQGLLRSQVGSRLAMSSASPLDLHSMLTMHAMVYARSLMVMGVRAKGVLVRYTLRPVLPQEPEVMSSSRLGTRCTLPQLTSLASSRQGPLRRPEGRLRRQGC